MPRKEIKPKLRPYRVDYFSVAEMQLDKALVRSVIVRAATASQAKSQILKEPWTPCVHDPAPEKELCPICSHVIIIRAYRFYKKLVHKKDVYKAVEDLFPAKEAVEVMEAVEYYREVSAVRTPCDHGNATNAPVSTCTHGETQAPPPTPTTGPDSPATKAVLADLRGMTEHDAHEQAMDTFQPTSIPEGKRFPDLSNASIDLDAAAPVIYSMPDPSLDYDVNPPPSFAAAKGQGPDYVSKQEGSMPTSCGASSSWKKVSPLWLDILVFGAVAAAILVLMVAVLHH